jgi:hypothetical protein
MDDDIEKALAEAFEEDFNKLVEQDFFEPVGVDDAGEALYQMTPVGQEFIKGQRLVDDFFQDNRPRTRRELGKKGHALTAAVEKLIPVFQMGVVMKQAGGRMTPMHIFELKHFPRKAETALVPEDPLLGRLMQRWGLLVDFATSHPDGEPVISDILCWERYGGTDCDTQLAIVRRGKDIFSRCPRCHSIRLVRSWEGTIWDRREEV